MYETSIATPFVTGVAALMLSVNPNLTAVQLKDIIMRSVDIVPALQEYCVTGGRLNAYKAVRTAQMYRFAEDTTYMQLATSDDLYAQAHGVLYDACSECRCRTPDYSCNNCGMCDPCENCHIYFTELHNIQSVNSGNENVHQKVCVDCGYVASTEAHTFEIVNVDVVTHHLIACSKCFYSYPEDHVWLPIGKGYRCLECNMYTQDDVRALTDDELRLYLSRLSNDELEALIANLHEDLLPSIAALLPRETDELLTE